MDHHLQRARACRPLNAGEDLLVTTRALLRPASRPADVEVVVVDERSPAAVIRENMDVNEQGFEASAPPVTDEQAESFRPQLRDSRAVTVRASGRPVAAGMMLPVRDGVAELAGIATLPAHRRRGYGRLATEALAGIAFDLGADLIILTTTDAAAGRLYRRMGFVPAGDGDR